MLQIVLTLYVTGGGFIFCHNDGHCTDPRIAVVHVKIEGTATEWWEPCLTSPEVPLDRDGKPIVNPKHHCAGMPAS